MQRRQVVGCVVAAFVLTMAAHGSSAAADNWMGTWKLNGAKSQFTPGPAPKSQTITYTPAPGGWTTKSESIDAQGKTVQSGYTGKTDGKDYPWTGNPNADALVLKRIDDNSFETTWKRGGKVLITSQAVVSNAGKTLTIHQTGKDVQGRDVNNTLVLDRQ